MIFLIMTYLMRNEMFYKYNFFTYLNYIWIEPNLVTYKKSLNTNLFIIIKYVLFLYKSGFCFLLLNILKFCLIFLLLKGKLLFDVTMVEFVKVLVCKHYPHLNTTCIFKDDNIVLHVILYLQKEKK